jgi:predicted nucleotidyltransferase
MKQELVKPIVAVGNSAGVLLPKEWLNGNARIELIEKPLNIKKDVIEIIAPYLENIMGIYLAGSYARGEQTKISDVDIIAITDKVNKKITRGRYDIILIDAKVLKENLKNNILPILPMLMEAKPLVNPILIKEYLKTKINARNLRFHAETTKSALKVIKSIIELAELEGKNKLNNAAYPLVLRLREVYIVDCLRDGKTPTTKAFIGLIKEVAGSAKPYLLYIKIKNMPSGTKIRDGITIEESKKIYDYVKMHLRKLRTSVRS